MTKEEENKELVSKVEEPMTCDIKEPWLTWFIGHEKEYEGRLYRNKWKKITVGTRIVLGNGMSFIVEKVIPFKTFGDAWEELGTKLVPNLDKAWQGENMARPYVGPVTKKEIDHLYQTIMRFTDTELSKCGVIAIKFILGLQDEK